jgi:hypothetical protein
MSNRRQPIVLVVALSAIAGGVRADEIRPEKLLPSTTQFYYRWDGVVAHRDAYRRSARGQMLAADTGKFLTHLYERLIQTAARSEFGEPALRGEDPDELAARHSDFRLAAKLPQLLAETGIVVGFEIRPPGITIERLQRVFGVGIFKDREDSLADVDAQLTLILPNAADRLEPAALLRILRTGDQKLEAVKHLGRSATEIVINSVRIAWWAEGKHLVVTIGTVPTKTAIERIEKAGDGITIHPLFKHLEHKQSFEVVSRAYGDVASVWRVVKLLLIASGNGIAVPVVELTGLPAVQSFRMCEGFDEAESRGVAEAELSGPREGVVKLYKRGKFDLKDLPPLPAEVNRWSAGVFDITAAYDMLLGFGALQELAGGSKSDKADLLAKRQELADEVDGLLGMKVGDMLANLGDLGVTYQTPGDGFLNAGQVFAVRIKNEAEFKKQFRQFAQGLGKLGRDEVRETRRVYEGIETHEFSTKQNGLFRPTGCVCDGWMVWGFFPQPVHGFILRSKGKLPAWKPDERTQKLLAAIPPGPAAVQYTDPRPTVKLLLSGAQPFAEYLNGIKGFSGIFEPGLLPNPEDVCRPLFPGIHWTHNDGKTIHWESRESLALPLEIVGIELPLGILAATHLK